MSHLADTCLPSGSKRALADRILRRGFLPAGATALALFTSGCASSQDIRIEQAAVAGAASRAADQIKRCYRTPRVASIGKQISTRVRVRFQPDGNLADIPMIVAQSGITPDNQAYAAKMAEAAGLAVIRCVPIKLPAELYSNGWNELDFTFSPRRSG